MMTNLKRAVRYVTFIPTGMEFVLGGSIPNVVQGFQVMTSDEKYVDYGFEAGVSRYVNDGNKFYFFPLNTAENLEKITNAYDLHYKAFYQGEEFSAGVSSYPQIILFAGTFDYGASATTTIKGFEIEAGNCVKKVDISEVTLIPIKTPIDLSEYLPS